MLTECFETHLFRRYHRKLRAFQLDNQGWFCLADVALLMGKTLDERSTKKLDPDQCRTAWIKCYEHWSKQLLISESALYTFLARHYIPENRALRYWLTYEVLPVLRDKPQPDAPSLGLMKWSKNRVKLLAWRGEYWVRLRDVPEVIGEPSTVFKSKVVAGWRMVLSRALERIRSGGRFF
ncbi:Bro-N domain-containing protein [Pseudomonas sp. NPDC090202]|uniref:BRO-N domain-containing protein n=1 Tax=unclassified Pseudomonas TaxID=196821 RepID=UPI0037F20A23